MDTTNILFVCGGAFDGLEKIIRNRSEKGGIGFGAEVKSKDDQKAVGEILRSGRTRKTSSNSASFPNLIGRLPVVATLTGTGRSALVKS